MTASGKDAAGPGMLTTGSGRIRIVEETPAAADGIPAFRQAEWAERWPWLAQGTTWRGTDGAFDLGLSGREPIGEVLARWRWVRQTLGFGAAVHSRQVHGSRVLRHAAGFEGMLLAGPADGHTTALSGLLLTVSVADCVPVFVVAPAARAVALLHAGWRGSAAGVLEAGVEALSSLTGARPADLHVHFGPAICGDCYEVGPEVHAALGLTGGTGRGRVDLRGVLAARAAAAGVRPHAITRSARCTRCEPDRFFSHRAGAAGRQAAWLGVSAS